MIRLAFAIVAALAVGHMLETHWTAQIEAELAARDAALEE